MEGEDRDRTQRRRRHAPIEARRLDVSSTAPSSQEPIDLTSRRMAVIEGHRRSDDELLTVRTAFEEGTYLIAVYGELDISTVAELQRHLSSAEATDAREIVVDLSALHFMDSTGIRLLFEAHSRSRADGDRLRLLRGSPSVHRAVEICGLDRTLPFLD
jgi:anti-anti-sigma factor